KMDSRRSTCRAKAGDTGDVGGPSNGRYPKLDRAILAAPGAHLPVLTGSRVPQERCGATALSSPLTMSEGKAPPGVICALITPFRNDEADLASLGRVIEFQLAKGIHGLFVLGTTGEGPILQPEERKRIAEFAVSQVAGRAPVIVHCGAPDTKTAAELAHHAEAIGADAVAVVAPFYFHYRDGPLYRHFTAIAEAAPGIDHYVYQNPEAVGYSLDVDLVLRLVDDVDNIRGVKDTGDSIARITSYLAHR